MSVNRKTALGTILSPSNLKCAAWSPCHAQRATPFAALPPIRRQILREYVKSREFKPSEEGTPTCFFRKGAVFAEIAPLLRVGVSSCLGCKFATSYIELLAARLDAWLQTALHAEHDLAAHFGCDGDKKWPCKKLLRCCLLIH